MGVNVNVFKKRKSWLRFSITTTLNNLLVALLFTILFAALLGYKHVNVLTGSMGPTIPAGSIIIVKSMPYSSIVEGDIVQYMSGGTPVTHRVAGFDAETGYILTTDEPTYIANGKIGTVTPSQQPTSGTYVPISPNNVLGVVVLYFAGVGDLFEVVEENAIIITIGLVLLMFVGFFA